MNNLMITSKNSNPLLPTTKRYDPTKPYDLLEFEHSFYYEKFKNNNSKHD